MSVERIVLLRDGKEVPIVGEPAPDHAVFEGSCSSCGASPFKVAGTGMRPSLDDRAYEADGRCLLCGARVGTIRAEMSTIFGVREDNAVLRGRPRVY